MTQYGTRVPKQPAPNAVSLLSYKMCPSDEMLIFFLGASLFIPQRQASVMGGVETEVFPSLPESGIIVL